MIGWIPTQQIFAVVTIKDHGMAMVFYYLKWTNKLTFGKGHMEMWYHIAAQLPPTPFLSHLVITKHDNDHGLSTNSYNPINESKLIILTWNYNVSRFMNRSFLYDIFSLASIQSLTFVLLKPTCNENKYFEPIYSLA